MDIRIYSSVVARQACDSQKAPSVIGADVIPQSKLGYIRTYGCERKNTNSAFRPNWQSASRRVAKKGKPLKRSNTRPRHRNPSNARGITTMAHQ